MPVAAAPTPGTTSRSAARSALDRPIDRRDRRRATTGAARATRARPPGAGPASRSRCARRTATQLERRALAPAEALRPPGEGPRPGLRRGPLGLGALAGAVRPHRRLPAPPLDPLGRDARDRGPAHRHRPHRARDDEGPRRRPVRQARRRDDEADQARPARARDARRHRRVRPAHRARLRRVPRPRPDPRGDPRGVRDAPGGRHRRRVPGRVAGPDADAAEVAAGRASTTSSWRSRSSARARSRATPSTRTCAASRGIEPVTYLHPSLEPILHDTLGVILYQEQVMKIAIDVAGFTPAGSDGFRRAMGTWRSTARDGEAPRRSSSRAASRIQGMPPRRRRGAVPPVRGVRQRSASRRATRRRSPGPRTSRASSSCSTRPSSSVGLINAQPMGFYPVEVLVNDAKRHGVAVLPVDVNRSAYADDDRVGGAAGLGAGGGRRATTGRTTATRASRCRRAAASTRGPRPCARPRA